MSQMIEDVSSATRPMHAAADASLVPDDMLALETPKRMVVQRLTTESGAPELRLFYGDKEVSFDEPHLFAFGETLARQTRFRAGDATAWGDGYAWDEIAPLLDALVEEGVLARGADASVAQVVAFARCRPSPLPRADVAPGLDWRDFERVTQEIAGRGVEQGYLELVIPIFRVAHPAFDTDGRQVGEANVFPRPLRADVATDWMACTYPGTRHLADRPMNVTALKTMRTHWDQMMAAVRLLRGIYLERYPDARRGWTIGHLERLATFILAVPTYQLVRPENRRDVLHPVLSSLFRVTDGLRMTMHQMMFVPLGEPTLPFDAVVSAHDIHLYAERNYSFHSETGVCAGPRHLVQMFLDVLLDGAGSEHDGAAFDAEVAEALADAGPAFDYALLGLRAHAALFCMWPVMARSYERLSSVVSGAVAAGAETLAPLHQRLQDCLAALRGATYLGTEAWRQDRERIYAAMFDTDAAPTPRTALPAMFAEARREDAPALAQAIEAAIAARAGSHAGVLATCLADYACDTQAILRVASDCQAALNRHLRRAAPSRPFEARDANVHNLLQEARQVRLPFLLDEIRNGLDLSLTIATDRIDVAATSATCPFQHESAGVVPSDKGRSAPSRG